MTPEDLHPQLLAALRDLGGELNPDPPSFRQFVERIDQALWDADADRQMVEHSLELSGAELLAAHEEVRAVLSSQPDIICLLDSDRVVRSCSTSSFQDLVLAPEMLVGRRIDRIPDRAVGRLFRTALEEARRTGQLQTIEYELAPDGKKSRHFEARLVPTGEDHWVVVIRNVEERKQLEAQLVQAQKLEAIAHLAAGIAHEINTPTQYVTDNTQFLKDTFGDLDSLFALIDDDGPEETAEMPAGAVIERIRSQARQLDLKYVREEVPKALEQSLEGLVRIARIVAAMKEFSHPGSEEMLPTDLNRALENTVTVSKSEWKYVADLELDLDADLPPVRCLPAELNQVFLNIIVNAAQAVSDAVKNGLRERGVIGVRTRAAEGVVEIQISDTGTGIPEEVQTQIFDPFFTTKAVGKGTGQGLSISHSVIVEKHLGSIHFETRPDVGTTFIIRLPIEGKSQRVAA